MDYKIILIGPMGAGKTSLGKKLAKSLSCRFIDTDALIISQSKKTISKIFAEEGENGFREREYQALKTAIYTAKSAVISCGGGIVVNANSRRLIMAQTLTIFLDISIVNQIKRVEGDKNRPLVQTADLKQRLEQLRDDRLGLYEGLCDFRIDTDQGSFKKVFEKLLNRTKTFLSKKGRI